MEYNYKVNHDIYGYRNPCFENYKDLDTIFLVGDSCIWHQTRQSRYFKLYI